MTRTKAANRPQVRLIWDELLSHAVPRALHELGFKTTHVGANGAPERGSSDAQVIEFARKTNQIIVTSNHDMMMLCDEVGQHFVWIDPRRDSSYARSKFCCASGSYGGGRRSSRQARAFGR